MKLTFLLTVLIALFGVLTPAQAQANDVQMLRAEIKQLKLEILKIHIELQQTKVTQAEQEWKKAQADKLQNEQQEQGMQTRLTLLDEKLKLPNLSAEEQTQIHTMKTQMQAHNGNFFATRKAELAQQEAEKSEKLQNEQKRLADLNIAARQLAEEK